MEAKISTRVDTEKMKQESWAEGSKNDEKRELAAIKV